MSLFCKVRLELSRPILDFLDPLNILECVFLWTRQVTRARTDRSDFSPGIASAPSAVAAPSGLAGVIRSFLRPNLMWMSVFCKVRLELLRPILDLLDPINHVRMCFQWTQQVTRARTDRSDFSPEVTWAPSAVAAPSGLAGVDNELREAES